METQAIVTFLFKTLWNRFSKYLCTYNTSDFSYQSLIRNKNKKNKSPICSQALWQWGTAELLTMLLRKPVSCEYTCEYSCFQLKSLCLLQVLNTSIVLLYFLMSSFLLQQLLKFASHTTKEVFILRQSLQFLLNLYCLFSTHACLRI